MNLSIDIKNITIENREDKFQKAIKAISKELNIPATIENTRESHGEEWPFKVNEELYLKGKIQFGVAMDEVYSRLCATLGILPVETFKKSIDKDARPLLIGKLKYNPQTGELLTKEQIDRFMNAVIKFLEKTIPSGKDIVINQANVSRAIAQLQKNGTEYEILREKKLDDINFDPLGTIKEFSQKYPDANIETIKLYNDNYANYIKHISDDMRFEIRRVLINGQLAKKSNHEVSQELFDKFGDANKQWDRVIETESVNIANDQYVAEFVDNAEPDEKVYFVRHEFADDRTCSFCMQAVAKPIIALYVSTPLQDDAINDEYASIAIWPGKSNFGLKKDEWRWPMGSIHPRCRGGWDRYYPEYDFVKFEGVEKEKNLPLTKEENEVKSKVARSAMIARKYLKEQIKGFKENEMS